MPKKVRESLAGAVTHSAFITTTFTKTRSLFHHTIFGPFTQLTNVDKASAIIREYSAYFILAHTYSILFLECLGENESPSAIIDNGMGLTQLDDLLRDQAKELSRGIVSGSEEAQKELSTLLVDHCVISVPYANLRVSNLSRALPFLFMERSISNGAIDLAMADFFKRMLPQRRVFEVYLEESYPTNSLALLALQIAESKTTSKKPFNAFDLLSSVSSDSNLL